MPLSLRNRLLACCCAALWMAGCSRPVLTTDQAAALAAAEGRWKRAAPHDYAFVYHPISFPALGNASARIEVRGGVVKSVAESGRHEAGRITIDQLFESIREASKNGHYARIEASYDPELGYPTRIIFTAPEHVRDGNVVIEIQSFQVLAGQ